MATGTALTDVSSVVAGAIIPQVNAPVGVADSTAAQQLVTAGWASAQSYAQQAFNAATTALNAISSVAAGLATVQPIDASLATVELSVAQFDGFINGLRPFPPSLNVTFNDADFSSQLLSDLLSNLDQWVTGAFTGLPPAIEQAIWDRDRARETVATGKKIKEVVSQFAIRGFTKPPGALAVAVMEAEQEAQNNIVAQSRDVAIKQADLQQSNRRFAFETAAKIEEALINYQTQKMGRALELARTIPTLTAQIYSAQASIYGADVSQFSARLQAETAKYRGDVDAKIATANLRVEAAKANMQALIEKVRVAVEAVRAAAQISSQLAAAALSAVNLSGGIHASSSFSTSTSDSRSRSISATIGSSANVQDNYNP
jgi:hypothetical protein